MINPAGRPTRVIRLEMIQRSVYINRDGRGVVDSERSGSLSQSRGKKKKSTHQASGGESRLPQVSEV